MKFTAYAGVKNAIGESAGCYMPCDSPEDGWSKIVAYYRDCEKRRNGWAGGMEAIYLRPVFHWFVRPAVFQ